MSSKKKRSKPSDASDAAADTKDQKSSSAAAAAKKEAEDSSSMGDAVEGRKTKKQLRTSKDQAASDKPAGLQEDGKERANGRAEEERREAVAQGSPRGIWEG